MKTLIAFGCGLLLGLSNMLWHVVYWLVIAALVGYIVLSHVR